MRNKFKKNDKVVSISGEGELEQNKIYTIEEIYGGLKDFNLEIEGLIWSYHYKNFMTLSDYRKLKLEKINKNNYE